MFARKVEQTSASEWGKKQQLFSVHVPSLFLLWLVCVIP